MNLFQVLLLLSATLILGCVCMNPQRAGNENFPSNPLAWEEEEGSDTEYPGLNVHYNFEPKDWRAIELNEQRKFEFARAIKEEVKRMQEDKLKMNHVLNIQKEQIAELLFMINALRLPQSEKRRTRATMIPTYLRTGSMNNSELQEEKIQKQYDSLNSYTFIRGRYNKGADFYFGLADQWVR